MGRETNEKITDGARGLYEKATGYVFPFPFSWCGGNWSGIGIWLIKGCVMG